jgi:hypothetical protein
MFRPQPSWRRPSSRAQHSKREASVSECGAHNTSLSNRASEKVPLVANVLWVQGRCYLTPGNQGPGRLEGGLSRGVRAIYERTNGSARSVAR